MRRSTIAVTPLVALSVAAIGLTGCGGGGGGDADTEASTVAPVIATLPRVELPESFPDAVPIPAGLELDEANELAGDQSTIYDITGWNAGDAVPLGEAYLAQLLDAGFEITTRSDSTENILFTVEGPEWFVSAGFYPDAVRNTGTAIGLTVGPVDSTTA